MCFQLLNVGSAPLGDQVFDGTDIERCERLLDEPRTLRIQEFTRRHIWDSDFQGVFAALYLPRVCEPVLECDLGDPLPDQRFHLRLLGILIEI